MSFVATASSLFTLTHHDTDLGSHLTSISMGLYALDIGCIVCDCMTGRSKALLTLSQALSASSSGAIFFHAL